MFRDLIFDEDELSRIAKESFPPLIYKFDTVYDDGVRWPASVGKWSIRRVGTAGRRNPGYLMILPNTTEAAMILEARKQQYFEEHGFSPAEAKILVDKEISYNWNPNAIRLLRELTKITLDDYRVEREHLVQLADLFKVTRRTVREIYKEAYYLNKGTQW